MPKKQVQRYLNRLADLAERLGEGDEQLSAAELDQALREAGSDPAKLREKLYAGAVAISTRLAQSNRPTPRYLEQVIHETRPLNEVDGQDPAADLRRLSSWLDQLASRVFDVPPEEALAVARAYRQKGELSAEDIATLDELEAELRARLDAGKDET